MSGYSVQWCGKILWMRCWKRYIMLKSLMGLLPIWEIWIYERKKRDGKMKNLRNFKSRAAASPASERTMVGRSSKTGKSPNVISAFYLLLCKVGFYLHLLDLHQGYWRINTEIMTALPFNSLRRWRNLGHYEW